MAISRRSLAAVVPFALLARSITAEANTENAIHPRAHNPEDDIRHYHVFLLETNPKDDRLVRAEVFFNCDIHANLNNRDAIKDEKVIFRFLYSGVERGSIQFIVD